MKTNCLITVLCVSLLYGHAQTPKEKIVATKEITWYGLDFSNQKLVGEKDDYQVYDLLYELGDMNRAIVAESQKYNLKKTFRKNVVSIDLSIAEDQLYKLDLDNVYKICDPDSIRISESSIQQIIHLYNYDKHDRTISTTAPSKSSGFRLHANPGMTFRTGSHPGIGLVFLMEYLDKNLKEVSLVAVFFDIPSKKVLHTERIIARPSGGWFRNYYMGAIKDVLSQLGTAYSYWRYEAAKEYRDAGKPTK